MLTFRYRVEPLRPALILIGVVLVVALIMPSTAARLLTLVFLSGPVVWSGLQLARRGCGVTINDGLIALQACLTRRIRRIPLAQVQAHKITATDQLAVAYLQPRRTEPGNEARPPRLRLYVTAALADPVALMAALPLAVGITSKQMDEMLLWRRVRRTLLWLGGLFVGIPTFLIILFRVVGALHIGGR